MKTHVKRIKIYRKIGYVNSVNVKSGEIMEPVESIKREFAGMADTYTLSGLSDTDKGFRVRVTENLEEAVGKQQGYLAAADSQREELEKARKELRSGPARQPDPLKVREIERLEAGVKLAEENAKAYERAATEYQRVLDRSNRWVVSLEKQVHAAKLVGIKDTQQQTLAQTTELAKEIQASVKSHTELRKSLPKSVLADTAFVQQFESGFVEELRGKEGGVSGELGRIRTQVAEQSGLTDESRSAWRKALEAFQAAPGVESSEALDVAQKKYDSEQRQLAYLEKLEGIYEQKLRIIEGGIESSQQATEYSKQIAHKLALQAEKLDAQETIEYSGSVAESMLQSFEGVSEQGLLMAGGPLSADKLRVENIEDWLEQYEPRFDFAGGHLQKEIAEATDSVEGLESGLVDKRAQRDTLIEAVKAETDPEKQGALAKELSAVEADIARDEASLGVAEQAVEGFVQQADRLDAILESVKGKLDQIEDRVSDREYDIQTRSEKNEESYFSKFTTAQARKIESGKFDMGYDMYVRSKDSEDLTDEERRYLERQKIDLQGDYAEYKKKEDEKNTRRLRNPKWSDGSGGVNVGSYVKIRSSLML